MKYSYFSTDRSGRSQIRNLVLYNKKTLAHTFKCFHVDGSPITTVIFEPELGKQTWYWEDKSKSIDCDYNLDFIELMEGQKKRPRPTHWLTANLGRYYAPFTEGKTTDTFYKSFDKAFDCYYILCPLPLLGYYDLKGNELSKALRHNKRSLNVDLEYSIEQFRKRRNIIVYKEDIKHWVRQWFLGSANYTDDFIEKTHQRINCARQFHTNAKLLLRKYDIPFEMFSLDTGDYSSIGFDKQLPRYCTDNIDTYIPDRVLDNVDSWVDDYMEKYP